MSEIVSPERVAYTPPAEGPATADAGAPGGAIESRTPPVALLLYAVFVLSGVAGLIYESIWSRYLGLFVGHSAYAQIIVIAIFLGGMSAGAMLIGRRSETLREPLIWYAAIEVVVGLIGLVFHEIYLVVTRVAYDAVFPPLAGGPALLIAKWAIAGALILPQSVLLGMTFPLMSAGVLRLGGGRPGRVLSVLYFSNSLGAAAGVLLAGFYLARVAGLPGTLLVAAVLNLGVGILTWFGVRVLGAGRHGRQPAGADQLALPISHAPALRAPHPASLVPDRLWRILLAVAFLTAVSSFMYEIAWIRMLSLVLGSATHSFELMLSAFILGLALGALWARGRADRFHDPLRALGVVQWLMGFAALATMPLYLESFDWMVRLMAALDRTPEGYALFSLARYGLCLAIMLPATFCAGITLPLITKMLLDAGLGERSIGTVYGINTLGSIAGVVLAGLVLLPVVGLKVLLVEAALIDMVLGLYLLRLVGRGSAAGKRVRVLAPVLALAVATFALALASLLGNRFDQDVLASGVYRYGTLPPAGSRRVLFAKDGRTASVTAGMSLADGSLYIATNGKPDASVDSLWLWPKDQPRTPLPLDGDQSTQAFLPLIALAHAPQARQAAVIGQGSGMTSHILLGSPRVERVTTIEIEPEMIRGSRVFHPANRRVFDDPRARFVVDDAKSFFAATATRYDLIISEPSNPWVSGVSGLFTTEFYQRVKRYLSDDGVFAQWIHLYEINDGLIMSVLAALHQNFRSYEIFLVAGSDILIVAGDRPQLPAADWSVLAEPGIADDLTHVVPVTPRGLEATRLLGRATLAPLLDDWTQANSDFYPILDLGTERARYLRSSASGFRELASDRFDIVAPFAERRAGFSTDLRAAVPAIPRMRALAAAAQMRAHASGVPTDSTIDPVVAQGLMRRWRLDAMLASGVRPSDWRVFMTDVVATEADIHGGTAGVADEAFFASVRRFLTRHDAPSEARAAVSFLHGIAAWDFAEASRAADELLPAAMQSKSWLPVDFLREAAVVAKLRSGDVAGARQYFEALSRVSQRRRDDLRVLLLGAHLRSAGRPAEPRRPTPGTADSRVSVWPHPQRPLLPPDVGPGRAKPEGGGFDHQVGGGVQLVPFGERQRASGYRDPDRVGIADGGDQGATGAVLHDRRRELGVERGTGTGVEPARMHEHPIVDLQEVLRVEAAEADVAAGQPVGGDRQPQPGCREHAIEHTQPARAERGNRRRGKRAEVGVANLPRGVASQLRLGGAVARLLGQRVLQREVVAEESRLPGRTGEPVQEERHGRSGAVESQPEGASGVRREAVERGELASVCGDGVPRPGDERVVRGLSQRPDGRVLREPLVELGAGLEAGELGAEPAVARLADGDELARPGAQLGIGGRAERRRERLALERDLGLVGHVEHGIACREQAVLAPAEALAVAGAGALEYVEGLVHAEGVQLRGRERVHDHLRYATSAHDRSGARRGAIDLGAPRQSVAARHRREAVGQRAGPPGEQRPLFRQHVHHRNGVRPEPGPHARLARAAEPRQRLVDAANRGGRRERRRGERRRARAGVDPLHGAIGAGEHRGRGGLPAGRGGSEHQERRGGQDQPTSVRDRHAASEGRSVRACETDGSLRALPRRGACCES